MDEHGYEYPLVRLLRGFIDSQGSDRFTNDTIITLLTDMAIIPKPVIGYIGALLSLRLDIEILEYIAESHPDWSLVLIGPEDEAFKKSRLHQMKNVYFPGNKKESQLPSYLHQFDVAINPQVVSPITIGNYPRKIDEYLAMGKPAVATKTEAMGVFSEYTWQAENKEEFVACIENALSDNNAQRCIQREEFAKQHTWENNVSAIYQAIDIVKSENKHNK